MTASTTLRVKRFTASRDADCPTGCGTLVTAGEQAGHIPGVDGAACTACCDTAAQTDGVATIGNLTPTSTGPVRQLSTRVHSAEIAAKLQDAVRARKAAEAEQQHTVPEAEQPTSSGLRILVTGSRTWTNRDAVRTALTDAVDEWAAAGGTGDVTVVHGDAIGADLIAKELAVELEFDVESHPAKWGSDGKAAGPLRNQRMVDLGADLCIAFPLGEARGTRDCMGRATKAGIRIVEPTTSQDQAPPPDARGEVTATAVLSGGPREGQQVDGVDTPDEGPDGGTAVDAARPAARTTLPTEPCPDCAQPIVWALTSKKQRMPVDAAAHPNGNIVLHLDGDTMGAVVLGKVKATEALDRGIPLHRHHRLTCAHAGQWAGKPDAAPGNPQGYNADTVAELEEWLGDTTTPPAVSQRAVETAVPHAAEHAVVAQLAADGATTDADPAIHDDEQEVQHLADALALPDLSMWAGEATARGTDPQLVGKELIEAFRLGILAGDIRGRQKEIGPSGLGHPCARATAYLLADVPPTGTQDTPWRQAVGTAMHDRGDLWAHLDNERRGTRWLTNLRVSVGELYPGRNITGTLDYLDVLTATVIDLKVPGTTAMKTYGPGKPESPQYRVQVHAYGRGVLRAGFLPAHVGILRVSPARELAEAVFKVEPFDERIAADALTRVGGIARMVDAIGPAAAAALPPTEHYCNRCDWFRPGATDLTSGCPGAVKPRRDSLDALVGH